MHSDTSSTRSCSAVHSSLTTLGSALLVATLASGAEAQTTSQSPEPGLMLELARWKQEHGATWRLEADVETGFARILYGGKSTTAAHPVTDADYHAVARTHYAATAALFGVRADTLVEDEVLFLPLGLVGSSDKLTASFRQESDGLEVRGGFVNVLMNLDGELLSVASTALSDVAPDWLRANEPTISSATATQFALAAFEAEPGLEPTYVGEPELVIHRELVDGRRRATLAWDVVILSELEGDFEPEEFRYTIAANGPERLVLREDMIHNFDVGGNVKGYGTPGNGPDIAATPEVPLPMAHMAVVTSVGTFYTDENGDFNIPGVTGPISATFKCKGLFTDVETTGGNTVQSNRMLTGTGNQILLNKNFGQNTTAQVNAFHHVNKMRDWVRGINPSDGIMDFVNTARVNNSLNCNATFNGFSTNYRQRGGGCPNTAFSSVIYHEQGHWLNVRYNTQNGPDGMGEGNADVFAMYQNESPIVGDGFFGPGTFVRTGENTRQYCGDGNNGCYGQVHADGEVHMGALWKLRTMLQATHGFTQGGDIANALHNGWMNAYNQTTINSIIETQYLILDDDNGNINDGTPHFLDIDNAFRAQGFPGRTATFVPSITPYGLGLGGANVGSLTSSSTPNAGSSVTFDITGIPNGTTGLMFVSTNQASQPLVGGTLLAELATIFFSQPISLTAGATSLTVPIDASAAGVTGFLQAFVNDASQPKGYALTNGLMVVVGG